MTRTLLVPGLVVALVAADFIAAIARSRAKVSDDGCRETFDTATSEQVAALRRLVSQGAAQPVTPDADSHAPRSSAFG